MGLLIAAISRPVKRCPMEPAHTKKPSTRQEEWRTFLFLVVVTAPILAVAIVGGYGFAVWMYQLLTGDLPG